MSEVLYACLGIKDTRDRRLKSVYRKKKKSAKNKMTNTCQKEIQTKTCKRLT
jgi:hypothetical protein